MSPIAKFAEQVLLLLGKVLPEDIRGFVTWLAGQVGKLDLPVGDPRVNKLAELVSQLMADIAALEDEPLSNREKARLLLENRFGRAWIESGLSSGGI